MRFSRFLPFILCVLLSACSAPNPEATSEPASAEQTETSPKHPDSRETTLGPVRVVVAVSNTTPTLGEQIELTLTVEAAQDVTVTMPDFGDQLGKFSIADYQSGEKPLDDGRMEFRQQYTLDLPMSGKLRTPSFLVEFTDNRENSEKKGGFQEVLTEEIPLEVASVFADGEAPETLYPAEGVLPELVLPEDGKRNLWLWILLGLAVLAAVGAVVFFKKRMNAPVVIPPDIVALRALDEMRARNIPNESKAVDAWYVELSSIVRTYIEGRYQIHAPRLTTEEFFDVTQKNQEISSQNKILLRKLLEQSDRVKFTGFVPEQELSAGLLDSARQFVIDTREVSEGEDHA